jgi:CMP-N,N'-diacetyllegionaminic acid synthase
MKDAEHPLVVASICARGGSKGVPRKNLRLLAGKPLIGRAVEQALACEIFDRVVASTDDAEMARVARAYGAEVPFMRPPELAQDQTNKWDVFRHLVTEVEAGSARRVGVIADLDTGAALRTLDDIEAAVRTLLESSADVCVTAYEADHNPYYNMVQLDSNGLAGVCIRPDKPIANRQQAPAVYNLSPAVFAIRRDALWSHDHWSQCRMTLSVLPRDRAVDIDTEFDFRLVESLLAQKLGS